MQSLLIVLGGGGHTVQMIRLLGEFKKRYVYEYVLAKEDVLIQNQIPIPGKIYRIYNPRKKEDKSLIVAFFKLIPSTLNALNIIRKTKAKTIIACGPSIAIPLCFVGKLFGLKIVFLESWSRVFTKSLAGRLVYPIANLFFVQWEQELKNYPKAIYAGRLG